MITRNLHFTRNRIGLLVLLVMVAAMGCSAGDGVTGEPASATPPGEVEAGLPATATDDVQDVSDDKPEGKRTVRILSLSGDVRLKEGDDAPDRKALTGEMLEPKWLLITGDDGEVVLELDDGTLVSLDVNSKVELVTLEGTTQDPVTQFFLNLGAIFAFREDKEPLSVDALFDVETPQGTAAIRGSSMSVRYEPSGSSGAGIMATVCLSGDCTTRGRVDADAVAMMGGQRVNVNPQGKATGLEDASAEELELGEQARAKAEEAASRELKIDVCHAAYDPAKPFILLNISYNAADGHGHEGHADDVIPAPAGGCPTAGQVNLPTATPQITATPLPSPTPTATPTAAVSLPQCGIHPPTPAGYHYLRVRPAVGDTYNVPLDTPLYINVLGWISDSPDLANFQNFMAVLQHRIWIDGTARAIEQTLYSQCLYEDGSPRWITWFMARVDPLPAGLHSVQTQAEVMQRFESTADADGDGQPDVWEPGIIYDFSGTIISGN